MRRNLISGLALGAVMVLALGASTRAGAAEPVKIRAGWINTPSSLLPILFPKPGIAKHEGVSYTLDAEYFSASPKEITAVAAGEIDIATLGYSTFSIAVENAGLTDLRIIADETQDGVPGYNTIEYRVLRDGPIKTVEDLKGKVLATNGLGAGTDIGMRYMLFKHHLLAKQDYTVVEVGFPNMRAVLEEHKVDLATATIPFKFDPAFEKVGRTLYTLRDALGTTELSFWTVRTAFLDKNRAALTDLIEDTIRAIRWYSDPANHAEAVAYLAKFTKRPADQLDWAFTHKDNYRDPNALPNLDALKSNMHAQKELGFINADLDPAPYADLSLVKEAAARVK